MNKVNLQAQKCLQVGLVGTGFAARRRAEALGTHVQAQLLFATGNNRERAQAFCQQHATTFLKSWEELISHPGLDLVIISTINCNHSKIARAALEAGKHVVIEYPLALNPLQAADLIELAHSRGKLLHVEHIELLGGLHQAIRQALPEIGRVFYARYITIAPKHPAPHRWTYNHQLYGFPLVAALSRINRFTNLFGKVARVNCQAQFWDMGESEYYKACLCAAQLRFHNGLIADITYGKGDRFWQAERVFELHGEQGKLIFSGEQGTLIRGEEQKSIVVGSRRGLFARDTNAVLEHLLTGKPLYISPQDSYYALKVADAARQSAQTGKMVEVGWE